MTMTAERPSPPTCIHQLGLRIEAMNKACNDRLQELASMGIRDGNEMKRLLARSKGISSIREALSSKEDYGLMIERIKELLPDRKSKQKRIREIEQETVDADPSLASLLASEDILRAQLLELLELAFKMKEYRDKFPRKDPPMPWLNNGQPH